ncbi:uncharacterized protein LOC112493763 [Cephus cinctus]|uniref:Uncharacterized protein LOC112493763 n=1 Tax=Cephus cinctus TaxID=211228 RepID=A0AAJ7VXC1_CEPCN|nr:uncharacterized protein LOC112493763 [Cephus cinctus]
MRRIPKKLKESENTFENFRGIFARCAAIFESAISKDTKGLISPWGNSCIRTNDFLLDFWNLIHNCPCHNPENGIQALKTGMDIQDKFMKVPNSEWIVRNCVLARRPHGRWYEDSERAVNIVVE